MAKRFYQFPYGVNSDGTPKIQARMTPEEYAEYKKHLQEMSNSLKENRIKVINDLKRIGPVYMPLSGLNLACQTCSEFKNIPYPIPSEPTRTVASSGAFQIIVYTVLSYFGKNVSVEELTRIANFGDWQHDKNGTWHHFVDVMCLAYGLDVARIGDWQYVGIAMNYNELVVALLDHKMFPDSRGNNLVLITGISNGEVFFYHPRFGDSFLRCGIAHFMLNTKVLWGITDHM